MQKVATLLEDNFPAEQEPEEDESEVVAEKSRDAMY